MHARSILSAYRASLQISFLTHPSCSVLLQVTLFTRGKTPVVTRIPDDTDDFFYEYQSKVKHIKGDRKVCTLGSSNLPVTHIVLGVGAAYAQRSHRPPPSPRTPPA